MKPNAYTGIGSSALFDRDPDPNWRAYEIEQWKQGIMGGCAGLLAGALLVIFVLEPLFGDGFKKPTQQGASERKTACNHCGSPLLLDLPAK